MSWIRFLQSVNLNGALCDDMGLGKTLQALIGIGLAHSRNQNPVKSLIICPSTLCGHWVNEILRFFPNEQYFRVLRYDGVSKKRRTCWDRDFEKVNLIVTSYSILRQDVEIFTDRVWSYCILDEGHLLKNPKTGA